MICIGQEKRYKSKIIVSLELFLSSFFTGLYTSARDCHNSEYGELDIVRVTV